MPKGKYPVEYFRNPNINKPLEEIYQDIDAYSGEFFADEERFRKNTDFIVVLPPLKYDGITTKGIFMSQGVDYIHSFAPKISEIFFSMAYTMWSSYPWSENADVYLTCYKNQHREDWYFKTHPEKKNKILIPLQDADFTNEYVIAPTFNTPKDIDLLYVSRISEVKNNFVLLEALKQYEQKYGKKLKVTMITGVSPDNKSAGAKAIIEEAKKLYGGFENYLELIDVVPYRDMSKYYSRAKFTILTSLIEGKNRAIQESMCANTPVIVFRDYNKYARGEHELFYKDCGLYVDEFSPEALVETIRDGLSNYAGRFFPRKNYLKHNGRKNFINTCVDAIPYFKENLPEYEQGNIQNNLWVDLAMQDNYQLSFNDFLYCRNSAIQHVKAYEENHSLIDFFFSRFQIKK